MFVFKENQIHEAKVELKGGKGTLDFCHVVPKEELCGAGTQFGIMTIPAGCSIGSHNHVENFEIVVVVEGEATITENGVTKVLKPGDAETCSNGTTHCIENKTDKDLKIWAVILWNQDIKNK